MLRRHAGRSEPVLEHEGLRLDPATRQVSLHGEPVLLSAREFAVLEALLARPGAILSRAQIEDRLYGWAELIRNVRGVGYYLGKRDA